VSYIKCVFHYTGAKQVLSGANIKSLFFKESSVVLHALLIVVVVAILIGVDLRYNSLGGVRSVLDTMATPIYWIADLPGRIMEWGDEHTRSRGSLLQENEKLRRENLVLSGRSQRMAALRAENARLRALLNSAALLRSDVLVAELLGVSPDPALHQLVLNKGARQGVFLGQPLIDNDGLMGQIVRVSEFSSRALLLTDATHSTPVQINRNGVRAIAEGSGRLGLLEIRHVSATTDIEVGDLLVTSGLGGRFPIGYPVAIVNQVERDPGQAFATVTAQPSSSLDRSRHVLLVFTAEQPE
jgi:rod shape-determining protein MreC